MQPEPSLVGKDIELDAIGHQFKPYFTTGCVCMLVAPLWSDLGSCSRTVVVKAVANSAEDMLVPCWSSSLASQLEFQPWCSGFS